MHPVLEALVEAESTWREVIKTEFPLFLDTKVSRADPDPANKRHWMFYTKPEMDEDGKERWATHMDVFKPDFIDDIFERVIAPMFHEAYGTKVPPTIELRKRLIHDTFTYLYFHEQFHPTFCPDSKGDEELVDKALYEGIEKAEPRLQKPQILSKVGNVRNAGWDQIIDGAFFHLANYGRKLEQRLEQVMPEVPGNETRRAAALPQIRPKSHSNVIPFPNTKRLPDSVIPIFDIIEFESKQDNFDSYFYPLTRAIYSMLFTRDAGMRGVVFDYFKDRITQQMREPEFNQAITAALKGVVSELSTKQLKFARVDKKDFETAVGEVYQNYSDPNYNSRHQEVTDTICSLFLDKRSRYDAMKGFIKPLAKYISLQKEEKRHGTHIGEGEGSGNGQPGQGQPGQGQSGQGQPGAGQPGGSGGDQQTGINQPGGNTEQALVNLANVLEDNAANGLLSAVANSGMAGGPASKEKKLSNLASDQYYKKNAQEVQLRSPDYEAVKVDLGKKRKPEYVTTLNLTVEEVVNLDLEAINRFQEETGIVQLCQLTDHQYQYEIWEWVEVEETDYTYENTGIDLPDNIVFHVDSSSSMGSPQYVGTGCPFDVLTHVNYGTLKTVKKKAEEMKKEVNVIAANFSNGTIVSDPVELNHMYNSPNNSAKKVLTGFQNGGTVYSPSAFDDIEKKLKPGKTVHIWATDGGLWGDSVEATYQAIEKTVQNPNTSFIYFDIGGSSDFGKRIQQLGQRFPNVQYHGNTTIQSIKNDALEVLIQYCDKSASKFISSNS